MPSHIRSSSLPRNSYRINTAEMAIPPFKNIPATSKQFRERENSPESSDLDPLEHSINQSISKNPSSHRQNIRNQTHFLEREPVMPVYQKTMAKIVKIKPMDKDLFFDGNNMPVEKFIRRYEYSGSTDVASARLG